MKRRNRVPDMELWRRIPAKFTEAVHLTELIVCTVLPVWFVHHFISSTIIQAVLIPAIVIAMPFLVEKVISRLVNNTIESIFRIWFKITDKK